MAGTKARYAGEDRGYGNPNSGTPKRSTPPSSNGGSNGVMNMTKPSGGRVANGAKIPKGSAYPTQDAQVDAYQGGKVIGPKRGLAVKGNK